MRPQFAPPYCALDKPYRPINLLLQFLPHILFLPEYKFLCIGQSFNPLAELMPFF